MTKPQLIEFECKTYFPLTRLIQNRMPKGRTVSARKEKGQELIPVLLLLFSQDPGLA